MLWYSGLHFTWNTTVFRSVTTPIMGHGTEHGGVPSQVQSAVQLFDTTDAKSTIMYSCWRQTLPLNAKGQGSQTTHATRMLSPCQRCTGLQAVVRACTPTLLTLQASLNPCAKSCPAGLSISLLVAAFSMWALPSNVHACVIRISTRKINFFKISFRAT